MSSPSDLVPNADTAAEIVWDFVRGVPPGHVVTYGQIADMVAEVRVTARQVGGIMMTCPPDVPWHRVIGSGGFLPIAKRSPELAMKQRELLTAEGVGLLSPQRVDLNRFRWMSFVEDEL